MKIARAVIVLLLLHVSLTVFAQESRSERKQRLRFQAISQIKQIAAEAYVWDNKTAAVLVLADAADLLWDETPDESRKWLLKAWALIDETSESPQDEKLKEFFTRSDQSELRAVVLSVARKHDGELGARLLKALSQKQSEKKEARAAFDDRTDRSEQLLRMAQQVVETKPEEAFALAASSLTDGISYSLQNVLIQLRKKNVEMANRLFDLALARFVASAPDPSEAHVLVGYLFQPGVTFSANSQGRNILVLNPAQRNVPVVAPTEPERARSFLLAVYDRLLTRPVAVDTPGARRRAHEILLLGNLLEGRFVAFAPEVAPSARGFLAQLRSELAPDIKTEQATEDSKQTAENTSQKTKSPTTEESYEKIISELEESADKEANPLFRRVALVKTALATKPEDYKRAKRIVEKIDDDDLKNDAVSFVLYRAAISYTSEIEVEKAIEIVPQIADTPRRCVVRIAIAQRLFSLQDEKSDTGSLSLSRQRAFELLSDVERDLKKVEPSMSVAKILLARTAILAKLDHAEALASLEEAIQIINKLKSFNLRDAAAPNLGLTVLPSSSATVASPGIAFDLATAIDPLVANEFEETEAIVGRLITKEGNGLARLEAAKLFLKKNPYAPPRDLGRVRPER